MIDLITKEKLKNMTEDELMLFIKKIAEKSYYKGYINGYKTGQVNYEQSL